ncbi:MAG TPA: hypothetical protein VHT05_09720 [Candidatus Elarobacter sp.]|nr:hypothetical protein [Candidatus Elarobacter sp.]
MAALIACVPLAALAAAKPFVGPTGWDHTVGMTATAASPRSQETWKKSDGQLITFLSDDTLSYDDSIAQIHKNVADNGFKPSVDKDRTCAGMRAHEIEMTFGTTVVHQIVVDDAPGVTKITYTHPQGITASQDALATITAYCGS